MEAIQYVRSLVEQGRKVGIFSCEDPYNTPFHRDLFNSTDYLLLVTKAGAVIVPQSLDLGLQAKGINAWGIFGHYGIVQGHEVCAAIKALSGDYSHYGPDLKRHLDELSRQFNYKHEKSLMDNVITFVELQYKRLLEMILEKRRTLGGVVQGEIIIFGGLVENSYDAKSYQAQILFSDLI